MNLYFTFMGMRIIMFQLSGFYRIAPRSPIFFRYSPEPCVPHRVDSPTRGSRTAA